MEDRDLIIMEEETEEIMVEVKTEMRLLSLHHHQESLQCKKNFKNQEVSQHQKVTGETTTMRYPAATTTTSAATATTTTEVVTAVVSVQVTSLRHVLMCVRDFLPAYLVHVWQAVQRGALLKNKQFYHIISIF